MNEKKLALPSEAALGFVLRVDMVDGGIEEAKDMCDHFASNPSNTGRTSTGVSELFLKYLEVMARFPFRDAGCFSEWKFEAGKASWGDDPKCRLLM